MEYKGSTTPGFDSDDNESAPASYERTRPVEPVLPKPERTLFGGVLFNRQEDRERSTTEVAREVIPGFAEPERTLPPLDFQLERFSLKPPVTPEAANEEDDDDEEADRQDSSSAQAPQQPVEAAEVPAPRHHNLESLLPPSIVEFTPPPPPTAKNNNRPARFGPLPPASTIEFAEPQPVMTEPELLNSRTSIEVDRTSPDQDQMEVMTDARINQPPDELASSPATANTSGAFAPPPPAAGNTSGGFAPPPPTKPPVPSRGGPSSAGWGGGNVSAAYAQQPYHNTYHPSLLLAAANQFASRRSVENLRQDYRRRIVAYSIMFLALGWYLGHRPVKKLRKEVEALQQTSQQQQEELTSLNYQQQEAQARLAEQNRQIEQFTRPQATVVPVPFQTAEQARSTQPAPEMTQQTRPVEVAQQMQPEQQTRVIGENGQQIVLQGNQHVEMAGAYAAVFNNQNEVVQNAIQYGDEYKRDTAHERPATPFAPRDSRYVQSGGYSGGAVAGASGGFAPMAGSGSSSGSPGGYTSSQYSLPMNDAGQTPNQEAQFLLSPPKPNPVVSAITSPWLWLGVGMLLIAFFIAATI